MATSKDGTVRAFFRFPWVDWANGKVWTLKEGEDFDISVQAMQIRIHGYAANKGIKARTRTVGLPQGTIEVQFYGREAEK